MTTGRVGHSKSCEGATKPPCTCQCGGAEHGWQEALDIAAESSSRRLIKREQSADRDWDKATRDQTGRRKAGAETAAGQHAATKSFIADVIRWLRRDPDLHKATKQLGEPFRISRDADPDTPRQSPASEEEEQLVETHVIPGLREKFGEQRIKEFQKKASATHFWCELLAQTTHALDEFKGQYNRAKRAVITVLTSDDGQRPKGWASLLLSHQAVIERAVNLVFKHLPKVATGGLSVEGALSLIWPARVLAVLM